MFRSWQRRRDRSRLGKDGGVEEGGGYEPIIRFSVFLSAYCPTGSRVRNRSRAMSGGAWRMAYRLRCIRDETDSLHSHVYMHSFTGHSFTALEGFDLSPHSCSAEHPRGASASISYPRVKQQNYFQGYTAVAPDSARGKMRRAPLSCALVAPCSTLHVRRSSPARGSTNLLASCARQSTSFSEGMHQCQTQP